MFFSVRPDSLGKFPLASSQLRPGIKQDGAESRTRLCFMSHLLIEFMQSLAVEKFCIKTSFKDTIVAGDCGGGRFVKESALMHACIA